MADDSRDQTTPSTEPAPPSEEPRPYRRPKPKHDFPQTQAGKLWDAFGQSNVNEMPGGMVNTAGGRPREVTWKDAFSLSLFTNSGPAFYQTGCARDALLVGIGTGGAIGGLSFILRGLSKMIMTTNIAVGGFTVASLGMHYWCTSRQREEAKGMAAAVAGMKLLHEKKAKEKAVEEAAAAARKQKEEEERIKNQRWYKFW